MASSPDVRRRIPAGDGAWVRLRRVTADKAVITGEDGRFMLLPMAEADALVAGDPGGARRRKLGEMGFLLDTDGEAPSRLAVSDEAAIHVLRLRELGEGAESVVTGILGAARGRPPLGDAAPTLRGFVHLEIVDADPLGDTGVREIVDMVAAHRTEKARGGDSRGGTESPSLARRTEKARGAPYEVGAPPPEETKGLSIRLRTRLTDMTPEIAASLVKGRVAIQCLFEGPPTEAEIIRIQMLTASAGGVSVGAPATNGLSPTAFVVGVIPLGGAALSTQRPDSLPPRSPRSGPDAIVGACRAAGLSFVELAHDGESEDLYREVLRRILDVQLSGSLLVEMGLATHLEALVARRGAAAEPRVTVWGADGSGTPEDTSGFGAGCGGCPYDPYCGRGLLRDPLSAASERRAGTSFCASSTAMFDVALSLLASPEGPRIQRAFRAWMAAHERVAKHQAGE